MLMAAPKGEVGGNFKVTWNVTCHPNHKRWTPSHITQCHDLMSEAAMVSITMSF